MYVATAIRPKRANYASVVRIGDKEEEGAYKLPETFFSTSTHSNVIVIVFLASELPSC